MGIFSRIEKNQIESDTERVSIGKRSGFFVFFTSNRKFLPGRPVFVSKKQLAEPSDQNNFFFYSLCIISMHSDTVKL
jgi:hypothetical protein